MLSPLNALDGEVGPELEQELGRQADALTRRVSDTLERLETLREFVSHLETQLEGDESMLRQLEGLLGRSAQLPLDSLNSRLRGERLRQVALDILKRRADDQPVHYRTWYEWVRDEGHIVAGKDPAASFLAAISRLDCVVRVGGARSGRYQLTGS
jgi:hypothetical protein